MRAFSLQKQRRCALYRFTIYILMYFVFSVRAVRVSLLWQWLRHRELTNRATTWYTSCVTKHQREDSAALRTHECLESERRWKTLGSERVTGYNRLSWAVPPSSPVKPLFALTVQEHTENCINSEVCRCIKILLWWLTLVTYLGNTLFPAADCARQRRKKGTMRL